MPADPLPCCSEGTPIHLRDLDHVYGFDFDLYECNRCRRRWVYAWYYGRGGWENVDVADVKRMLVIPDGEMKAFMKVWAKEFD